MKPRPAAILAALALSSSLAFADAGRNAAASPVSGPEAAAWRAASERWAAGLAYKPRRASLRSEELDAAGKVLSWEESELALDYGADPENPKTTILRSTKNGEDNTAERRAKGLGGPPPGAGGGKPAGSGAGPFGDPVPFAAGARAELGASSPLPGGGFDLGYSLGGKASSRGRVRFAASGEPLALDYGLDPLPAFVYRFDGRLEFAAGPAGSLVAERMSFSVEAGLLGIKKRFRMSMSFADWARP
jgi:hypothetical protein